MSPTPLCRTEVRAAPAAAPSDGRGATVHLEADPGWSLCGVRLSSLPRSAEASRCVVCFDLARVDRFVTR